MADRLCSTCGAPHPEEHFRLAGKGHGWRDAEGAYRRYDCRFCEGAYNTRYNQARAAEKRQRQGVAGNDLIDVTPPGAVARDVFSLSDIALREPAQPDGTPFLPLFDRLSLKEDEPLCPPRHH